MSTPAWADNISLNIAASGPTTIALSGGSAQTTIKYFLDNNGASGCSASSSKHVIYDINIGAPSGVTASPSKLDFTSCNVDIPVTFTATSTGSRAVTLTQNAASAEKANPNNAAFTLVVNGSTNTAPHVSVGGVTNGASYEYGSVPTASCTVTDAEDPNPAATPTLSEVTGTLSHYGLGSQTATCTYRDGGGLSDTATATYSIVDTTDPTLATPGSETIEATSSDGAEATWADPTAEDNVALAEGSPSCDVASPHTFDLGPHVVNCSATDVAGNTTTDSFTITVTDTTGPNVTAPGNVTAEATSPAGAMVTYSGATATDTYDGELTPSCVPASGSAFVIGDTTVTCTAKDSSNNSASATFTVHVVDRTPPTVTVPADMIVEATSPDGAHATYTASATDVVDGAMTPTCDPTSGDEFDFGTTTVTCTATDAHGNTGTETFLVTVRDTTPPAISSHADVSAEATGSDGALVTYMKPAASDEASTVVTVDCIPESGALFALGTTTVHCTATDQHGNHAYSQFDVQVVDTTAPSLTLPADQTIEATGPSGAALIYTSTASDLVDGITEVTCDPASGSTFALGVSTVNCSSTDAHSNEATGSFKVTVVDTTKPTLHLPANITTSATSAAGATVSYTATAEDLVDTSVSADCSPASGSTFAPGTTTVNCSATDDSGNAQTGSFTVTVNFGWNGFFQPVDNNGVLNTIKGGQTVPMKWNISDGSTGWIGSLDVVKSVKQGEITCSTTAANDAVEATTTGGTSLRYDTTANQYIYNWQAPKTTGKCYSVNVTLTDGTSHVALFKTK